MLWFCDFPPIGCHFVSFCYQTYFSLESYFASKFPFTPIKMLSYCKKNQDTVNQNYNQPSLDESDHKLLLLNFQFRASYLRNLTVA